MLTNEWNSIEWIYWTWVEQYIQFFNFNLRIFFNLESKVSKKLLLNKQNNKHLKLEASIIKMPKVRRYA